MSHTIPSIAAVVTHEVESYDNWVGKFDAHAGMRKEAGILGHHVNRGADNDELLAVYLPAESKEQLESFLANDELRAVMRDAGVKGTPSIKVMYPKSVDVEFDRARAGMLVVHAVASYDKWRATYDAFDAKRTEMGITGHAVNVLADDPSTVVVYHQADSVDTLKAFADSDELKSAMKEAGVSSAPEITFWNAAPAAQY